MKLQYIRTGDRLKLKYGGHQGTVTYTDTRGFRVVFDGFRDRGRKATGGRLRYAPYQAEGFERP